MLLPLATRRVEVSRVNVLGVYGWQQMRIISIKKTDLPKHKIAISINMSMVVWSLINWLITGFWRTMALSSLSTRWYSLCLITWGYSVNNTQFDCHKKVSITIYPTIHWNNATGLVRLNIRLLPYPSVVFVHKVEQFKLINIFFFLQN